MPALGQVLSQILSSDRKQGFLRLTGGRSQEGGIQRCTVLRGWMNKDPRRQQQTQKNSCLNDEEQPGKTWQDNETAILLLRGETSDTRDKGNKLGDQLEGHLPECPVLSLGTASPEVSGAPEPRVRCPLQDDGDCCPLIL